MRIDRLARSAMIAALCAMPALAQAQAKHINLDFSADLQADGVPVDIVPDASLAPALQGMVRKRVAEWRYRMGTWQGRPVPVRVSQRIVAEAVPVSSGGFALRIKEVTAPVVSIGRDGMHSGGRRVPPEYPRALQRDGAGGTLVYAVRADAAGKPQDIERVHPQTPNRVYKLLDASARASIEQSTFARIDVAGQPLDCRQMVTISFSVGDAAMPATPDTSAYRALHDDLCPELPVLSTRVAGTVL